MTHAELQAQVVAECDHLGLAVYALEPNGPRSKGWPDLVIVGRRVLYRELKSQWDVLTGEQMATGWKLRAAGADWNVWRPSDWAAQAIHRELAAIRRLNRRLYVRTSKISNGGQSLVGKLPHRPSVGR